LRAAGDVAGTMIEAAASHGRTAPILIRH